MSSGTQIDLDWTGVDAGQGGTSAPPTSAPNATGSGAGAYLTDEEILGIEPVGTPASSRRDVIPREAGNLSSINDDGNARAQRDSSGKNGPRNDNAQVGAAGQAGLGAMPAWMQTLAGDPQHGAEAQQLWQEHQAFRASFSSPEEARTIKEMFPGGAQEAQSLKQASQSVDRIDAAIFSGDVRAQSEVVAELAAANPAAFRSLFAEAAKVLAGMGLTVAPVGEAAPTLRQNREEWGTRQTNTQQTSSAGRSGADESQSRRQDAGATSPATNQDARATDHQSPATSHQSPQFDPAAYSNFERTTNDAVARDVRSTIGETLSRVLPEGVAEGAARRIGEDIFNEIHRALAADRTLSEQVGDALRAPLASGQGWRFGSAEQQRVASMLAGRAKQLVPSVARRVIGEWTSSVLGTARNKAARQAAAASHVDIAAPGGSLDSMPLRAMSRREVDYASMSDDEILGM